MKIRFFVEDPGLVEKKVDYGAPKTPRSPDLPRSFGLGPS
jgi:hypothetical protein